MQEAAFLRMEFRKFLSKFGFSHVVLPTTTSRSKIIFLTFAISVV
jgi:hypothetical protein